MLRLRHASQRGLKVSRWAAPNHEVSVARLASLRQARHRRCAETLPRMDRVLSWLIEGRSEDLVLQLDETFSSRRRAGMPWTRSG